uniref:Putative peroxisomal bioproteinsis protein peroxin n=1 Tax=Corethrella appendiculata TaxID=1370023 RepID=U5EKK5_9DIPT
MEVIIKVNSQTQGRDKIARLIQYFCRAAWSSYNENDFNNIENIKFFQSIESTLSLFRKLLRFGKGFEVLYSSIKTSHFNDLILKITVTISRIASGLFLLYDHLIWLSRAGFAKTIDLKSCMERSNRFWLISLAMNLCRDYYELLKIYNDYYRRNYQNIRHNSPSKVSRTIVLENKGLVVDTIKNTCDIFIPLNTLGYTKFSPMFIGLLGVTSSIAGLLPLLHNQYKF